LSDCKAVFESIEKSVESEVSDLTVWRAVKPKWLRAEDCSHKMDAKFPKTQENS